MQFETVPFGSLFACPQKNGLTRPKEVRGEGLPMVNMGELFAHPRIGHIDMELVPVSHKEADFLMQPGDLLFARQSLVRDGAGQCSIFMGNTSPTVFESHLIRCRLAVGRAVPDYYFYFFRSPQGRTAIDAIIEQGAGAAGIRGSDLVRLEVPAPPLRYQQQVVEILKVLDDRIDLLHQTNTTLESIAQALFKSWFIDFDPVRAKQAGREPEGMDATTAALFPAEFEESALGLIPKGWTEGVLGNVCTNPRSQAKPGQMPPDTPYIGLEHMPRRRIALGEAGTAAGLESGKFWFERNDVLFGKLRPYFHKVALAPCRGICSTDILVIRPLQGHYLGFVAMHAFSDELIAHTTLLSNGARMPRTSWHDIETYKVVLPDAPIVEAFDRVSRPLFERIYSNIEAARTLAKLRETLLPRLISGKLRLPEAKEQLEEALT
ncbi:restriction endonuclease subunit S [Acidithiobacillus sp.]|uniref:restriction endonuclease subunit S n=1 Tax=Acidithiobacillus sp. TaxID=1872118 RepID=UPI0031FEB4EE